MRDDRKTLLDDCRFFCRTPAHSNTEALYQTITGPEYLLRECDDL